MDDPPVSLHKPPTPRSGGRDEATRHLCAGMYLDREFRDAVLRQVHNDPDHRVAPSYGFDLVPVVVHAWRAWALETAQHMCVLAVFVIGFVVNAPATITATVGLGLWHQVHRMLRAASQALKFKAALSAAQWLKGSGGFHGVGQLREQVQQLKTGSVACLLLSAVTVVTAWLHDVPLQALLAPASALLLLVSAVVGTVGAVRQHALNAVRRSTPPRPPTLTRRLKVIDDEQSHSHVIHPAPEEPEDEGSWPSTATHDFIGSGKIVHRWMSPLTIPLLRPGTGSIREREYTTPPFRVDELIDHLRRRMLLVGKVTDPTRLPGFDVRSRVYVCEADIAAREHLLRERDLDQPCHPDDAHHDAPQYYLEISTTASGEVVTTVFVQVTIAARTVNLQLTTCALTHTPADYRVMNEYTEIGKGAILRSALRALHGLPSEVGRSWRLCEAPELIVRAALAQTGRPTARRRLATVGTRFSAREEASTSWEKSRSDVPHILKQMKIIEVRLLKTVEDFLESRKVDTSAFKKHAENIISANVLNMGDMKISNSAVGGNPRVNYNDSTPDTPVNDGTTEGDAS